MDKFIKKEKEINQNKLRNLNDTNPKRYWQFINKLGPNKNNTNKPTLEEFYDHFKTINERDIEDNRFDDIVNSETNINLDANITIDEITKCVKSLKNGKACSPFDEILNEYIKASLD